MLSLPPVTISNGSPEWVWWVVAGVVAIVKHASDDGDAFEACKKLSDDCVRAGGLPSASIKKTWFSSDCIFTCGKK